MEVVLGEQVRAAAAATTNPFTPQFRAAAPRAAAKAAAAGSGTSGGK